MTFEKWLAERGRTIEAALRQALASRTERTWTVPERLAEAMEHAVIGGGKRMRPFLVIETAVMLGASAEAAMPAAVALELVHCYSLVHDDLPAMDNDALRRGQPSVWKRWDDWTAILAGDALLTLAFEIAVQDGPDAPPAGRRLAIVTALAVASGRAGMVGGQCLDLEADKLARPAQPTAAHIERLQGMKTGALFAAACRMGAIVAGADDATAERLERFGATLGAAFQLADDLLDVEGSPETLGKATGKDAAANKATLIGHVGRAGARARLAEIEARALAELTTYANEADVLRQTLHFAIARDR